MADFEHIENENFIEYDDYDDIDIESRQGKRVASFITFIGGAIAVGESVYLVAQDELVLRFYGLGAAAIGGISWWVSARYYVEVKDMPEELPTSDLE